MDMGCVELMGCAEKHGRVQILIHANLEEDVLTIRVQQNAYAQKEYREISVISVTNTIFTCNIDNAGSQLFTV
eukprot:UN21579